MKRKKELVISSGTYLNKGGEAIAYGTLLTLNKIGFNFKSIVDPDPSFPEDFYYKLNIQPIFRWSDSLSNVDFSKINIKIFIPFFKCLTNSYKKEIIVHKGKPIWYIGDSSLNDYKSVLSLAGQIISLRSLKTTLKDKLIVNASMGYMRTRFGAFILKRFCPHVDYFFVRGKKSYNNLLKLNVPSEKISIVCDFAYFLNAKKTDRTEQIYNRLNKDKPIVALIFKPYKKNKDVYIKRINELKENLEQKYNIYFVPTSYVKGFNENDLLFLKELGINNDKILDISYLDPEEIIEIFRSFGAVITVRLHGAVFATLAGVPVYHIYEADNSLDVIGDCFGDIVPLLHISKFIDDGPETITNDLDIIISKKSYLKSEFKSSISSMCMLSEKVIQEQLKPLIEDKLILDIGCGEHKKENAIGVDVRRTNDVDIIADAKSLPFKNEAFDYVYSSHVIEHFSWRETDQVLNEWVRVLKKQGTIEIRCPWLRIRALIFFIHPTKDNVMNIYGEQDHQGNYHKAGFSFGLLKNKLTMCGITKIKRIRYNSLHVKGIKK